MTRAIYEISGSDAQNFLQGLITNDISKLDQGLVYTAILTPQGKYLADFFLLQQGDTVLLDVDANLASALIQRLNMYKLRADVKIIEADCNIQRGIAPPPDNALPDPRHSDLGWRRYGHEGGDDGTDWDAIRVAHCIPETGIELTPDTFILEAGFERLNGVDFRKGCYVGQEVTARMKHKTKLRKGLCSVHINGTAPVGTEIKAGAKTAGTLYTQADGQAIAYLRFDRATGDLHADGARITLEKPE